MTLPLKVRCINGSKTLPYGVKFSTPITVTVVKFLPSPTPVHFNKKIAGMNL